MNYYFLNFQVKHKTNDHYFLIIEDEDGQVWQAETHDLSLIDRLDNGDPTAEDDAILFVKIQNGLI